jgi:hypothetical protein
MSQSREDCPETAPDITCSRRRSSQEFSRNSFASSGHWENPNLAGESVCGPRGYEGLKCSRQPVGHFGHLGETKNG